ncbi:hypothetical protein BDZ91DRAFT_660089 [Kalaharituber pfeilii]|nr:hypothetical protein BDZ91DRAFT_660089 [Kalaharituber pfeilii]
MTQIPNPREEKDALIVGIDFGTTYSGIAWASTRDRNIKTIRTWPGEPLQMDKVKTELAYKDDTAKPSHWGYQVKQNTPKPLRWFKLLLQNVNCDLLTYESTDSELRETLDLMPQGKLPQELAADYLRAIHNHFRSRLKRTYRKEYLDQLGKEIPVHYYLTVPTIWTQDAKNLTRAAAKAAGIGELGTVKLISEPEAAAAHCFTQYEGTKDALKVRDVFVIVDCGGGTVDIISYEVTTTTPLRVAEVAVGTGGLYGSVFLNDRFEALVRSRIGESAFANMTPENKEEMMHYFETRLKKTFRDRNPDENWNEFFCPVPGVQDNPDAGVLTESLMLSAADVKSIFEPIFRGIVEMVQAQVDEAEENSKKPVKAIILVGGFGSSEYLHQHLSENVKSGLAKNISVLQAPEAWQAVVQGAVQHGLSLEVDSGIVQARKVRESYGVAAAESYDPLVHPRDKVIFSLLHGGMICPGRMQWFITRVGNIQFTSALNLCCLSSA